MGPGDRGVKAVKCPDTFPHIDHKLASPIRKRIKPRNNKSSNASSTPIKHQKPFPHTLMTTKTATVMNISTAACRPLPPETPRRRRSDDDTPRAAHGRITFAVHKFQLCSNGRLCHPGTLGIFPILYTLLKNIQPPPSSPRPLNHTS
ncbi:uncharacterized protein CLUP02_16345 [Colletotrichum lupini]|uniref:Uncharacterized protein n=1 Tax=Colletotrichum lupini TaxID=145971 RepID=A0A9Q8T8F2_9PEZI|nr:uncharacterized protein CLUP02_16345 [Colletotrichum lupini]UQC90813.1 hypothetical protein CLUP02_16345 [Colletotrichum lupini]